MTGIRARIDIADVVLLLAGLGILVIVMGRSNTATVALGSFVAYASLITALFIVPRLWFDG